MQNALNSLIKQVSQGAIFSFQHPEPRLQKFWLWLQCSVLLLPFSSLLGSLGILLVVIRVGQRKFKGICDRPINRGFAVLSLLMLISTVLAFKPIDAALGLFNFLPLFFVFAALSELIQTVAQLRTIAWILVVTSAPVVVIGLGQKFWGWVGQVQILWAVVSWTITPTGNPPGRMASIFFYANVLASYLVVTFILCLGLWIDTIIHSAKRKSQNTLILLTLILLGNTAALILTDSRNAWLIAVLACLAFALYCGWHWLLVGVGGATASVVGAAFGPSPLREGLRAIVPAFFWARLTDQLYPDRPYVLLRTTQWKFALSLVQQRPWFGWGLRNFNPLYEIQMNVFIGHPHNLMLMLMSETGLPATLLLLSLVGWIVVRVVELLHAALMMETQPLAISMAQQDAMTIFTYLTAFLGCAVFSLFDITLFDIRINVMGWLLLSGLCGVVYHSGATQNS